MGYIKNTTTEIVVDAVLTRAGLEKLALNQPLKITRFALSDDEVDYSLYNLDNPNGSDYYDAAISNLPILQATLNDRKEMKYRLFTSPTKTNVPVVTYTINMPIPSDFSDAIGISQALKPYTFIPAVSPVPDDDSRVYYVVTITARNSVGSASPLSSILLRGTTNVAGGKAQTADLTFVQQQIKNEVTASQG